MLANHTLQKDVSYAHLPHSDSSLCDSLCPALPPSPSHQIPEIQRRQSSPLFKNLKRLHDWRNPGQQLLREVRLRVKD